MIQYISYLMLVILGAVIFVFILAIRKQLEEHQLNLSKLRGKIERSESKQLERFSRLNVYDFLRYNLREALANQKTG